MWWNHMMWNLKSQADKRKMKECMAAETEIFDICMVCVYVFEFKYARVL